MMIQDPKNRHQEQSNKDSGKPTEQFDVPELEGDNKVDYVILSGEAQNE